MARRLLLIIDLQKGWRHKTATEVTMQKTIELAKQFNGQVIHCCFRNDPQSLFHTQIHWKRFVGSPDTDQIPEIVELGLPVYWRTTYSCLTDEIKELVKAVDHVYIAGVFTDISVAVTAMELFDANIPVSVVRDCVATLHGQDVHRAALVSLEHAIGGSHLVESADVLQ